MNWHEFKRGVFLVNVLGIIYDAKTKKILIGERANDKYLKNLSWCFAGGRPAYKNNLEFYLKKEIKKKTGLVVNVKNLIFAKTYPEKRQFLSLYYLCQVSGGKLKAGEKFKQVKWVKPMEVKKYFTTSLDPALYKILKSLK